MGEKSVKVVLNGKEILAKEGERFADIFAREKVYLSAPCYHPYLTDSGHCGMCLVGARRHHDDPWNIVRACTLDAKEGTEVNSDYGPAQWARAQILLTCLAKHPLDCAKCNKVGDCFLYQFAKKVSFAGMSRLPLKIKLEEFIDHLGNDLYIDRAKCVNCQRCVRFCRDVLEEEMLGMCMSEGGYKRVEAYAPSLFENNNYWENLVELCPAGALINMKNHYQPTQWSLVATPSISMESSVGINTYVLHKKNKIFRIIPRKNDYVNQDWITNSAREEFAYLYTKDRVQWVTKSGQQVELLNALTEVVKFCLEGEVHVVCSGTMSLEDQFLFKLMLTVIVSNVFFLEKERVSDGFLISDDGSSNTQGAWMMHIAHAKNVCRDLSQLNTLVQKGKCRCIIVVDEDIFSHGVSYAMPDNVRIVYIGSHANKTSRRANIVIPIASVFETIGTYINKDGRLQRAAQCVEPPHTYIYPLWYVCSLIINAYQNLDRPRYLWLDDVWKDLPDVDVRLKDIDFYHIPPEGILLNNKESA